LKIFPSDYLIINLIDLYWIKEGITMWVYILEICVCCNIHINFAESV